MNPAAQYEFEAFDVLKLEKDKLSYLKKEMRTVLETTCKLVKEDFIDAYFDKDNLYDNVHLLVKSDGNVAGYIVIKFYRIRVGRRRYAILRPSAHIIPAHRGKYIIDLATRTKFFRYFCKYLSRGIRSAALIDMASPLGYRSNLKYFLRTYPNPSALTIAELPRTYRILFEELVHRTNLFSAGRKLPGNDFVIDYSEIIGRILDENMHSKHIDNEYVKFYKRMNPNYSEGHSLLVLIPANFTNIASFFLARFKKLFFGKAN